MIRELVAEGERMARPSLLLSVAPPSVEAMGWWRGRNPDWFAGRQDDRHRISIESGWLSRQGIPVEGVISVYDVAPRWGWTVPFHVEQTKGVTLSRLSGAKPLAAREALSWPPLEALCLYGGDPVADWLASMGLGRTDYDQAATLDVGMAYVEHYKETSPLQRRDVVAVLGGWHAMWPDDEFYIPREMRLVIWTLWDSEPWVEVFQRSPNFSVRARVT